MADAKKCDRCGKLFEPYMDDEKHIRLGVMAKNIDFGQYSLGSYDLCEECKNSLNDWLDISKAKETVKRENEKPPCFGTYDKLGACEDCDFVCKCLEKLKREDVQDSCLGAYDKGFIDCELCKMVQVCKKWTKLKEVQDEQSTT